MCVYVCACMLRRHKYSGDSQQICVFVSVCLCVCVCVCVLATVSAPARAAEQNKTEQSRAIIPRQAAALCLCAPLPVGPHIIRAATLIHHGIVALYAGPLSLSLFDSAALHKETIPESKQAP